MEIQSVTVGALKSPSAEDLTRLSTLSVVSKCLNAGLSTESLLQGILETILPAFQADRGFVKVFGPTEVENQECYLDLTQDSKWQAFTFTSTLLRDCLKSREAILVLDSQEELSTESAKFSGIRSVMLTPLVIEQRLLGAIYLDSVVQVACFEPNDLRLCKLIADMVSVAVDRNQQAHTVLQQSHALDQAQAKLEAAAEETIRRLSLAAEFRDGETSEHLTRVAEYSEALALKMEMDPVEVRAIKIASLLHDVGKLGIPDSILLKPGRFTDYERQVMQQHTYFGAKVLRNSSNPVIQLAEEIALNHHEKWDGSGYPEGLSGEAIPLAARIVAVADVFDAVSSARRYKQSYSLGDSFELLRKDAGSHFDPRVIEAFLEIRPLVEDIWNRNQGPEEAKLKSTPSLGVEFDFPETPTELPTTRARHDGLSVAVVDADPYQRESLSKEAARRGFRIHECAGQEDLQKLLHTGMPDAVILELADPGADFVLSSLRAHSPALPILILSRDGELARRLSVVHLENLSYLHKPLPPAAVLDELEECLPEQEHPLRRTVLALDDDVITLKVIQRVLLQQGFGVVTVSHPLAFWDALIDSPPDLILLDLEMPTVSGFEVCRVLRGDVKFRHLPIIVLTSHIEVSEYRKALEAGADDVLSKPLQAKRLLSRIESRLARNRALQISGTRDPMTGLFRRRLALRMSEQMFAASLQQGLPFSVCALRLDEFDALLESRGWRYSANIFREVTEILVRTCRAEDLVTRFEDFSLLMVFFGLNASEVELRIAGLNARLAQQKGPLSALKCSGRIASAPQQGTDLTSLLEHIGFDNSGGF